MKGLLLKDYINFKSYFKIYIIAIILFAIISILNNSISLLSGITVFITIMLITTSFTFDTSSKWNTFILTTPITRKDIVKGKYILTLIVGLIASFFTLTLTILINLTPFMANATTILEICIIAAVTYCITLIMMGILLPFIFKFGPEKARIILFAGFALILLLIYLLMPMIQTIPSDQNSLLYISLGLLLATILIYIGSYFITLKIFNNKELV